MMLPFGTALVDDFAGDAGVCARATVDAVVAFTTVEIIVTRGSDERIVTRAAEDEVVAVVTDEATGELGDPIPPAKRGSGPQAFLSFSDHWSLRLAAELNGQHIRLARGAGGEPTNDQRAFRTTVQTLRE